MRNVLLFWDMRGEEGSDFFLFDELSDDQWEKLQLCHNEYINGGDSNAATENALDWLCAFLEESDENRISLEDPAVLTAGTEPITLVVSGFIP